MRVQMVFKYRLILLRGPDLASQPKISNRPKKAKSLDIKKFLGKKVTKPEKGIHEWIVLRTKCFMVEICSKSDSLAECGKLLLRKLISVVTREWGHELISTMSNTPNFDQRL